MRTRIKTIQVDGQAKAVKEWRTIFGEHGKGVLATAETPQHASSNIRKVLAHKRTQNVTTVEIENNEKEQRRAAFMAMPRQMYKQVYGI